MSDLTAEQFAQRAFDVGLLDERQVDAVWAEFGTRNVNAAEFRNLLVRRELLTNFQLEKLIRNDRSGYFYGDYKMLYLVGTGTFARVFRAVNVRTGQVVAVKVLRKRWSEDPEKTEQFLREGQMGASLRHPAIVPIYEVNSDKRTYYLVMEFVEGHNLRHFVRVREKVEPMETIKLMSDVCSGLAHAFDLGVTHRDLKLSNILVAAKGRAMLVDFGLAAIAGKMSDEALSQFPNPRTIDYAALERATGVRKDDKRSDIYFAGCIMYNMLSGKAPLRETKDRLQRLSLARFEEIVPITTLVPDLPVPLAIVVNKSMDLNPTKRYQTPAEMLEELRLAERRITEGDVDEPTPAAETAAGPSAKAAARGIKPAQAHGKAVMIVESNISMQDLLREQLKKCGYRVLVFSDPARAMGRFQDTAAADCVMFCCNQLGEAALTAFNEFGRLERTKRTPAVLLLNEKQNAWQSKAQCADHRRVISMPIRIRELRETVAEVMAKAPAEIK
jgi:serine/threonine-protein kinase